MMSIAYRPYVAGVQEAGRLLRYATYDHSQNPSGEAVVGVIELISCGDGYAGLTKDNLSASDEGHQHWATLSLANDFGKQCST